MEPTRWMKDGGVPGAAAVSALMLGKGTLIAMGGRTGGGDQRVCLLGRAWRGTMAESAEEGGEGRRRWEAGEGKGRRMKSKKKEIGRRVENASVV